MKLRDVAVREIFDSRGDATLEAAVLDGDGRWFRAQLPSGKSRGKREAFAFPYDAARAAVDKTVCPAFVGKRWRAVREVDARLEELDSTPRKECIGGNVALGFSVAMARAIAYDEGEEIWELLRREFFPGIAEERVPRIFSNFVNGGAHAANNLDIQEYLVVALPRRSVRDAVHSLIELYRALGSVLQKRRKKSFLPIGDEGGYALDFENNFAPLALLERLIDGLDLENEFLLGIDAAASNFYHGGKYRFEQKVFSREKLAAVYEEYARRAKLLFSFEDPFAENDGAGFRILAERLPEKLIVGDDLTTTDADAIARSAEGGLIRGVIIKPNQIGTIAATCRAINTARGRRLECIISHRSGETEDTFIVHLAKACAAESVKLGAPARERMMKFNELIRLYDREV